MNAFTHNTHLTDAFRFVVKYASGDPLDVAIGQALSDANKCIAEYLMLHDIQNPHDYLKRHLICLLCKYAFAREIPDDVEQKIIDALNAFVNDSVPVIDVVFEHFLMPDINLYKNYLSDARSEIDKEIFNLEKNRIRLILTPKYENSNLDIEKIAHEFVAASIRWYKDATKDASKPIEKCHLLDYLHAHGYVEKTKFSIISVEDLINIIGN